MLVIEDRTIKCKHKGWVVTQDQGGSQMLTPKFGNRKEVSVFQGHMDQEKQEQREGWSFRYYENKRHCDKGQVGTSLYQPSDCVVGHITRTWEPWTGGLKDLPGLVQAQGQLDNSLKLYLFKKQRKKGHKSRMAVQQLKDVEFLQGLEFSHWCWKQKQEQK